MQADTGRVFWEVGWSPVIRYMLLHVPAWHGLQLGGLDSCCCNAALGLSVGSFKGTVHHVHMRMCLVERKQSEMQSH